MNHFRRGWTLVELLVVIGIVAVLAALLFPAFVSARKSALKAVCIEHFRTVSQASLGYLNDYDDRFTPASQNAQDAVGFPAGSGLTSHTWVQLLLPYATNFSIFLCPSDDSHSAEDLSTFDEDIVPGDLYSRYYAASKRVNTGFNYMAFSPIVRIANAWVNVPSSFSAVTSPSDTLMYLDSAWSVNRYGQPSGGGSWLVAPPCRFEISQGRLVDMFAASGESFDNVFAFSAWSKPAGRPFGGAYPWHTNRVTVAKADGSVSEMTVPSLIGDCRLNSSILSNSGSGGGYNWAMSR